jgi:Pyruvate/2-oxoacid:ferredoxin oxidoreductase delta subunit
MLSERIIEKDFHELFESPDCIKPYVYKIVGPGEEKLMRYLGKEPKSVTEVSEFFHISFEEAKELVDNAYRRANIHKSREDPDRYYAATLYDRLGYFTQYEQEAWLTIPKEERKIIDDWYVEAFSVLSINNMESGKADTHSHYGFLPIRYAVEKVLEAAEKSAKPFYVVSCNCRTTTNACSLPRETCIHENYGPNTQWDRGHGRQLSLEELRDLLYETDKAGLMHSVSSSGHVCNCDSCCCYPTRMALNYNLKGEYRAINYVAVFDRDKCINCGLCAKRCHLKAFKKDPTGKIRYDPSLCWGCGICETACPKGAIKTVLLHEHDHHQGINHA